VGLWAMIPEFDLNLLLSFNMAPTRGFSWLYACGLVCREMNWQDDMFMIDSVRRSSSVLRTAL
jgi:hypothetical protein